MDAKELRLGNYVNYAKEKRVLTCYGINTDKAREQSDFRSSAVYYQFYNKDIYGIKLTEEWLLKLGFKLEDDYGDIKYYENGSRFGVCLDHEDISFFKKGFNATITTLLYGDSFFQHVHQLQNLYFALTGEELIIK